MPKGQARILIGAKGTHGCSGYPVVGAEGKVHGCHPTREAAIQQQSAIYASQSREAKKSSESTWTGFFYPELIKQDITPSASVMETGTPNPGYQGCDCATCKELNCDCEHCPVCRAEATSPEGDMDEMEDMSEQEKYTSKNITGWGGSIFDLNPFVK